MTTKINSNACSEVTRHALLATLCIGGFAYSASSYPYAFEVGVGCLPLCAGVIAELVNKKWKIFPEDRSQIIQLNQKNIYFPNPEEFEKESLKRLHQIWTRNNEIFIKIIKENKIPPFGFHRTDKKGIEGIEKDKTSRFGANETEGPIYIAGSYQFEKINDPVIAFTHYLAIGFFAAMSVDDDGAILVVDASSGKIEKSWVSHNPIGILEMDTQEQKEILQNFSKSVDLDSPGPKEILVSFSPSNYDERIITVLKAKNFTYKISMANKLFRANQTEKSLILERFKTQELLFKAFQHLKVIPCNDSATS